MNSENKHKPFSLKERLKSFVYAFDGIKAFLKSEHNVRIHLVVAFLVIVFGCYYHLSSLEWIAISFAIGLVIAMEMMNTAIECLCDYVSPEKHKKIKYIKDVAAGAVLVCALVAVVIGLIIFLPKIFK